MVGLTGAFRISISPPDAPGRYVLSGPERFRELLYGTNLEEVQRNAEAFISYEITRITRNAPSARLLSVVQDFNRELPKVLAQLAGMLVLINESRIYRIGPGTFARPDSALFPAENARVVRLIKLRWAGVNRETGFVGLTQLGTALSIAKHAVYVHAFPVTLQAELARLNAGIVSNAVGCLRLRQQLETRGCINADYSLTETGNRVIHALWMLYTGSLPPKE
jgi:hypothetical protein